MGLETMRSDNEHCFQVCGVKKSLLFYFFDTAMIKNDYLLVESNDTMKSNLEAEEYVLQDYEKVDAAFSIGEFDYSYEEIDELGERIEILLKVYGTIYALRNDEEPIHYDDQDMLKSLINGELH